MPGTSTDAQPPASQPRTVAAPSGGRVPGPVRVTNIYATPWHVDGAHARGELSEHLRLWRYEQYYRLSSDQFPNALASEPLDPAALTFSRWKHPERVAAAQAWLFALPSGQIVAAVSLDVRTDLIDTIDLLEDCYAADICVSDAPVGEHARALAARLGAQTGGGPDFLPERHQLVLDPAPAPAIADGEDVIQRVIYRYNLPFRREYSAIRYPGEMNRRPGWLAAVGPYVSVARGHPEFLENSLIISTVQAVGASAQLREIRQAAYADVRQFRTVEGAGGSTASRRRVLEQMADQLGDLELELSYSVEATADLGLLVPSLRAESFHKALYESMSLASKAVTTGKMLQRLAAAISAELTAIESAERRADDNRRARYAIAVGFVSAVAIPASLILAFLGINASQVNSNLSMFSHRYLWMYLTIAAILVTGAVLFAGLYVQQRLRARHQGTRSPTRRPRWAPSANEPAAESRS